MKPNILLITTDQQRFDTINALGYENIKTPNLNRLVNEGCAFVNAYSPNPVCIPARHNILTGLSAKRHGFDDNYFGANAKSIPADLITFPQVLSDNGYNSIAVGKMHFQPTRCKNGFQTLELMEEIPERLSEDEYAIYLKNNGLGNIQSLHGVRHLLYMSPQTSMVPIEHHGSKWVADRTIHHLKEETSKESNFFIWTSFIAPHPPFDTPKEWADMYTDKNTIKSKVSKTPISTLAEENKNIANFPNESHLKRVKELYFSSISFVDEQIGRILDELEKLGEIDNTIIIFTSDHGEMLGDFGTYQKFLPYDSSSKVPFIVRYPKKLASNIKRVDFVDLNDIFPSLIDACELDFDTSYLIGKSIFEDTTKAYQYIEHSKGNRRWVSIRNQSFKYNYYYGGGKEELFDMVNDDETTNLLVENSEKYSDIKNDLKLRLIKCEKEFGLDGCIKNDDFVRYDDFDINFYREKNPPMFPKYEDNEFKSLECEVIEAISNETIVNIEELDTKYFEDVLNIKMILKGE